MPSKRTTTPSGPTRAIAMDPIFSDEAGLLLTTCNVDESTFAHGTTVRGAKTDLAAESTGGHTSSIFLMDRFAGSSRGIAHESDGLETLMPRGVLLFSLSRRLSPKEFNSSVEAVLRPSRTRFLHSESLFRRVTRLNNAASKKAYVQLMTLVAFNWEDSVASMLDGLVEVLDPMTGNREEDEGWAFAITVACSRGYECILRSLLQIFLPLDSKAGANDRVVLKSLAFEWNILHYLANSGIMYNYDDPEKAFAPEILAIMRLHFGKIDLLFGRDEGWFRNTPLHYALEAGDGAFSLMLMKMISSSRLQKLVNGTCGERRTPLHVACTVPEDRGGTEVVRVLCEQGANLQARLADHRTPLHIAAEWQHCETVRYLLSKLQHRKEMHPQDIFGMTPLMLAENRKVMMEFATLRGLPELCQTYETQFRKWSQVESVWMRTNIREMLDDCDENIVSQRNNEDQRRYDVMWYHFPANNIEWCDALLTRWFVSNGKADVEGLKAARRAFDLQHTTRTWRDRFLQPGVQISQTEHNAQGLGERGRPEATRAMGSPKHRQIFIAVPFMHFETMANLEEMKEMLRAGSKDCGKSAKHETNDEHLHMAYADKPEFHPRRTLDQYFHPSMDTDARDGDQVVQRYQLESRGAGVDETNVKEDNLSGSVERRKDVTTIMVDQLWIWILSDDILMTSFPQRWNHMYGDPHDVYGTFSKRLTTFNSPMPETAAEVAMSLMVHCFGTFDRHAQMSPNIQFMSMFEESIAAVGAEESRLLKTFAIAYKSLKQKGLSTRVSSEQITDNLRFVEILSDLTHETDLLSELKDIRDELHMMKRIVDEQRRVSQTLMNHQLRFKQSDLPPLFKPLSSTSTRVGDHEGAFEELNAVIDQGLQEIIQLDEQAARLGQSLTELLQLKQAHLNAFELEFSRKLSLDAANQSRAVLVFTIVTIVFSPLSFVAAFFTMPLTNLPTDNMTLAYVSKYVFVLGFAIALPCIALAFYVNEMRSWWTWAFHSPKKRKEGPESEADVSERASEGSVLETKPVKAKSRTGEEPIEHTKDSASTLFSRFRKTRDSGEPELKTKLRRRWRDKRSSRLPDVSFLPR